MANVNTTLTPQLESNQAKQTVSKSASLVQTSHQPIGSDPSAAATTFETSPIHDPSSGPSTLQGRDEDNSGGITHHSRSLHRPDLSAPHLSIDDNFTDDTTVQQLREIVAAQHDELLHHRQTFPTV
ncbi:MAG: hypothetical protein Q9175_004680 [Cornicularia normoerica]